MFSNDSRAFDFLMVHRLFGISSLLFAILILALLMGSRRDQSVLQHHPLEILKSRTR